MPLGSGGAFDAPPLLQGGGGVAAWPSIADPSLSSPHPAFPLADFLSEGDTVRALSLWYGERNMAGHSRVELLFALDRDVARLDALLSAQVDAILHHPRLQHLEASWRGLLYLTGHAAAKAQIRIKVMDVRWSEICRDVTRTPEFDQSQFFRIIHDQEFGMPGGEPFGLILGDYEVRHRPFPDYVTDDVAGLEGVSHVAAAAFVPFVVGAHPALLGLERYEDVTVLTDMAAPFQQEEYRRWKTLQKSDDSRFIGVVAPRVLMRPPYGNDPVRWDGFCYRETSENIADHLWGSAVYAFGAVVIRAYAEYNWNADIRGVKKDTDAGGLVTDLPILSFETDRPGVAFRYSTQCYLTDRQENDLCELGLLSLTNCQYTPYSAFFSNASMQRVSVYDRQVATINARMSAMLQNMLCVSRFAHYIKVMARDWVGSLITAEECERRIGSWLENYCTGNDNAGFEAKARSPLREASVTIQERPDLPGVFFATVFLKPHFQLDHMVSGFKLVTTLPGKQGS
ncbi:MAG: type VI secretion system contractile sheath large subunit [Magnetococcus sp. DMHC-1]